MPLEILPDRFGEAKHEELDKAMNKNRDSDDDDDDDDEPLSSLRDYHFLVEKILLHSREDLDQKYHKLTEFKKLFNAHKELRNMLSAAWERKSYRDIRNLAILAAPESLQKSSWEPAAPDVHQTLSKSFKAEYHGAAVDGFCEYLAHNEESFRKGGYYAKFCSIVQSSGTGKSRLLTELCNKGIMTIYMNLRDKDDILSFPPRDRIPSDILSNFRVTEQVYTVHCYTFFLALFDTIEECLSANSAESVTLWVRQMSDMSDSPRSTFRDDFFDKLANNYRKAHSQLRLVINQEPSETQASSIPQDNKTDINVADTDIDIIGQQVAKLIISGPNEKDRLLPPIELSKLLEASFLKMYASLRRTFPEGTTKPKLVIAIDEAHPLSARQQDFRPADVFCRVVKEYSHINPKDHGVWVVFASTTSKVGDFSPPNKIHNSHRIAIEGEKLFLPYTQLGWDQSAPPLRIDDVENVSQLKNIVGFGRPLWWSLKNSVWLPGRVLETASEKLCGKEYNPSDTNQVLAVLGQRFAINITFGHPDSVVHLENGVANHMRVCLATTLDRTWRFTSYPSEPLLSSVAAINLHRTPKILERSLEQLLNFINAGMIDMGERGELTSRLLWLLAKDLFIRTQKDVANVFPPTWDDHLIDCQMIPVVDWLEFIFGTKIWDKDNKQTMLAREAFQNAFINFSHWVRMDTNIAGQKSGELPLNAWTLRHWQRTCAVQCCHQQPLIDKVIPIYFKGEPGSASAEDKMSQILVSDKARESASYKDALHSITRRAESIGGQRFTLDSGSIPYIAILTDLAWQPPSFSITFPERGTSDPCLRIYAAGVDIQTYTFLSKYPVLMAMLEDLVRLQKIPETNKHFTKYLDAQVKFGSTGTPEHMEWERGRTVPPSPRESSS